MAHKHTKEYTNTYLQALYVNNKHVPTHAHTNTHGSSKRTYTHVHRNTHARADLQIKQAYTVIYT